MRRETSEKYKDFGLLLLRIGIGLNFVLLHGLEKITGGSETWTKLGGTMGNLGVTFAPEVWGMMSALAEFVGGLFLIFGFLTRPVAFIMAFNMFVALFMHFTRLDPWSVISHPLAFFAVLIALIFTGAGRFSLDHVIFRKRHVVVKTPEEPVYRRAG